MFRKKTLSFGSKRPGLRARRDSAGAGGLSGGGKAAERFEKSEQGGSPACNFRYGAAAVQGFRPHMQDDFACVPIGKVGGEPLGYFAVFDGHGHDGDMVSQYCAENFIDSLMDRKSLRNTKSFSCDMLPFALRKTFLKFDMQLREAVTSQNPAPPGKNNISFVFSGTTATMALVLQEYIIIANTGDSRTLLCRSGSLEFATTDHNPGNPVEDRRITAAGGKIHTTPSKHKVILDTEAYTNLAVSRTLGDFGFKATPKVPAEDQIVTPIPDVTVLGRDNRTDEFLLLASDGVFKSLSNAEVVDFVYKQLAITDDLTKICHDLIEMAYYSPDCVPDDTTVVLVVFPSAPTPSPKAIREEESLEVECLEGIKDEIEKIVKQAEGHWVLENEFNIIQQLVKIMPRKYCVQLKNKFIKKELSDSREDRFGVKDLEGSIQSETKDDESVYIPETTDTQEPDTGGMEKAGEGEGEGEGEDTDVISRPDGDHLESSDDIDKLGVPSTGDGDDDDDGPAKEINDSPVIL